MEETHLFLSSIIEEDRVVSNLLLVEKTLIEFSFIMTIKKSEIIKKTKTGGRQKGSLNKTTKELKDMILLALDKNGGADYFVKQATLNPNAFMGLVAKMLPTNIKGDIKNEHSISTSLARILQRVDKNS